MANRNPKRLLLLKAIRDYLLAEIKEANGYTADLAEARYDKRVYGDEIKLPAVSILENFNPEREPAAVGGMNGRTVTYDQVYLLNGWADDTSPDRDEPNNDDGTDAAQRLMADVKMALGKLLTREAQGTGVFNGLAHDLEIEPGVVRPADETSTRTFFWLRIRMKFIEKVGDPYWIRD